MERPIILFLKENDKYGWLSNWSKHSFYYNGIKFNSVEQFIAYKKAETFGDRTAMDNILETKTPIKSRTAARQIRNFHYGKWKRLRSNIIYEALKLKTTQNPDIIENLRKLPKNARIGMADKDPHFGIGFTTNDKSAKDYVLWKENIVGEGWMYIIANLDKLLDE